MTEHKFTNKLINEESPYLLQHAHNPVDWYPWCEEAFARARSENKPIFLSIGYSTCHWCHVMEKESFEDEEVASFLNRCFVCIKVDREERPDIDHIYMTVCQALTGNGGWPLSIFMTPDKKPFYAGTYFPKNSQYGMPGFLELLDRIHTLWIEKPDELKLSADQIIAAVQEEPYAQPADDFERAGMDAAEEAFDRLKHSFDRLYGGFGSAPKFPAPHILLFLMRYYCRTGNEAALDMASETLLAIYRGGIHDHIGFGFSRYSTDRKWLIPHFEKMLYDNALLAVAYLECFQITGNPVMRTAAEEIFTYVLRDMTSPDGGFYSAEDADSEGEEGKYYVWTPDEIAKVLGEEEGREFCSLYNITAQGNFEGKSIPNLINATEEEINKAILLDNARAALLKAREKRVHPHKDDKILTSWNGMMIASLAIGGRVLGNRAYIEAAEKAYEFIVNNLQRNDGRLLARYRNGDSGILGYADDYAFLTWACMELFESTGRTEFLKKAMDLCNGLMELFWDEDKGGLFLYGKDGEQLISRPKEIYDGAYPSANSQTVMNLLRLSAITGNLSYSEKAHEILNAFGAVINGHPSGCCHSLSSVLYTSGSSREVTVIGMEEDRELQSMKNVLFTVYDPFMVYAVCSDQDEKEKLEVLIPRLGERKMVNGKATAYVCANFACREPVTTAHELKQQLVGHSQLYANKE